MTPPAQKSGVKVSSTCRRSITSSYGEGELWREIASSGLERRDRRTGQPVLMLRLAQRAARLLDRGTCLNRLAQGQGDGAMLLGAFGLGQGHKQKPLMPRPTGRFRFNEPTFAGGAADVSNAPTAAIRLVKSNLPRLRPSGCFSS